MLRNTSKCWKKLKTQETPNFNVSYKTTMGVQLSLKKLNLPSAAFLINVCDSSAHTREEWRKAFEFRAMLILAIFRSNIMYFDIICC